MIEIFDKTKGFFQAFLAFVFSVSFIKRETRGRSENEEILLGDNFPHIFMN